MSELTLIHSYYKFSLESFIIVINRAIDLVAEKMNPKKEVEEPAEGEEGEEKPAEAEAQKKRRKKLKKCLLALLR